MYMDSLLITIFVSVNGFQRGETKTVDDTEAISDDAAPEDLEAARSIIDNLTRQLKVSFQVVKPVSQWYV
uniref:Uncharacterized protein n=1 Tax=Parascaris equorum TaxID=6256 RepID=A0A914R6J2_PAREQ